MWVSEMTTRDRQPRRGRGVASPAVGGLLLVALAACASHTSTTGLATIPKSPSSVFFVPMTETPTVYAGAYLAPAMHAVLQWTRAGSMATGTIELEGSPQPITVIGPGTYPVQISFNGTSFTGSAEVNGQPVAISGQVTPTGVDLEFNASTAINPTLSFTSIGPGGYSYPPSYPAG
jgi:hypothetical protein